MNSASKESGLSTGSANLDPEALMDSVGSWNRYQGLLTALVTVICILFTYSHYLPILYLVVPEHHCFIPAQGAGNMSQEDLKELFIPLKDGSKHESCYQYDVNLSEILQAQKPKKDWDIIKCRNGWTYELENHYVSVATEFNLVCDDAWIAPLTEIVYFIGSAIGMLFYGWIGDRFGRFWTIILCFSNVTFFGIVLGFSPNVWIYGILRFFMGISTVNCLTSSFILAMEYVSKSKRTIIGNFAMGLGIALGGFIMPGLLYWTRDWRMANHLMFAQGIFIFILPRFLNESVRWLLERKDYQKVLKILKKVSSFNGNKLDSNTTQQLKNLALEDVKNSDEKEVPSVLGLFKSPRLRKHIIVMIILWSLVKLLFETHLRSIKLLDIHVYYTFALANILEFLANILIIWTMEWFGRRWMTLFCLLLSGIPMFGVSYYLLTGDNKTLVFVLSMVARFGIAMVINVVLQFQMEIFPTDTRSRASGLILFTGELSAFFSPLVIYSSTAFQILPQIFMGTLGVLLGFLGLCLPETTGLEVAANAKEGEAFGRNQNFFYLPILKNLDKKKRDTNI